MDGSGHIAAPADAQVLDDLGELGLALARDLQAAALAAEAPADKARLAGAFHKVARGVRQGIALKHRIARDRQAFACEIAPQLARAEDQAAERRSRQLQGALANILWDEHEYEDDADYSLLAGEMRRQVQKDAELPGFADEPFEAQLARYRARFDPATWDFGGDDDDDEGPLEDPLGLLDDSS